MRNWLLPVMLALTAAKHPAPDPFAPQNFRQPTKAELKRCPHLAWIDYRAIAAREGKVVQSSADPAQAAHAAIRGTILFPHPADADILISTSIGPGETQDEPTSTSGVLWRDAAGVWWYDAVDRKERSGERVQHHGRLAADQAAGLDKAFADPCFALEPDYLPFDAPIRKGKEGGAPHCYSFITSVVRIEHHGQVRTMLQCEAQPGYQAIAYAAMYPRSTAHY